MVRATRFHRSQRCAATAQYQSHFPSQCALSSHTSPPHTFFFSTGAKGMPGIPGHGGTHGLPGDPSQEKGTQGTPGAQGLPGTKGMPGITGNRGISGFQGMFGNKVRRALIGIHINWWIFIQISLPVIYCCTDLSKQF